MTFSDPNTPVGAARESPSQEYISRLAARAKKGGGRDGTKYGRSRISATSFFVHHTQQLSVAAQVGDAKAIRRKVTALKMRLIKGALNANGRAK